MDDGSFVVCTEFKNWRMCRKSRFSYPTFTVYEEVASGLGNISQILLDYHEVSHALSEAGRNVDPLLAQLQELQSVSELEWLVTAGHH